MICFKISFYRFDHNKNSSKYFYSSLLNFAEYAIKISSKFCSCEIKFILKNLSLKWKLLNWFHLVFSFSHTVRPCVRVCVCVCVCVLFYVQYKRMRLYEYTHIYMHLYVYVYSYLLMFVLYIEKHSHTHTHTHIYIYIYIYIYMCVCNIIAKGFRFIYLAFRFS